MVRVIPPKLAFWIEKHKGIVQPFALSALVDLWFERELPEPEESPGIISREELRERALAATDWTSVISAIHKRGLTQVQIASACSCAQATISDLAKGITSDPRHTLGVALIRLSEAPDEEIERIKSPAEAKAA